VGKKLELELLQSIKKNIKSDMSLKEASKMDFSEFEKIHVPKINLDIKKVPKRLSYPFRSGFYKYLSKKQIEQRRRFILKPIM